jgi:hypothetical protein
MMSEMRRATWSGLEGRLVVRCDRRVSVLRSENVQSESITGLDPDAAMQRACDTVSVRPTMRR